MGSTRVNRAALQGGKAPSTIMHEIPWWSRILTPAWLVAVIEIPKTSDVGTMRSVAAAPWRWLARTIAAFVATKQAFMHDDDGPVDVAVCVFAVVYGGAA